MPLSKPVIEHPGTDAPDELEIEDIVVGEGAEAKPGDTVEVHYVGVEFRLGRGVRRVVEPRPVDRVPAAGADPGLAGGHPGHEGRRPAPAHHPAGEGVRAGRWRAPALGPDAGLRHRPARRQVARGRRGVLTTCCWASTNTRTTRRPRPSPAWAAAIRPGTTGTTSASAISPAPSPSRPTCGSTRTPTCSTGSCACGTRGGSTTSGSPAGCARTWTSCGSARCASRSSSRCGPCGSCSRTTTSASPST